MYSIREGEEEEYRSLVQKFEGWCQQNKLQLNISKTKEMVLDFRRAPPSSRPITIQNAEVEVVSSYKYLGLQMDDKLNWSKNMECVYKKVVCWGGSARKRDTQKLNRIIRRAGSVVGLGLDSVEKVVEQRTLAKLRSILSNESQPLYPVLSHQRSSVSTRLRSLNCSTDRLKNSFVPHAIRLSNAAISGRGSRGKLP
ncbi:hypothetical protein WMY93_016300 [Mugilogobius chulae]|uniref:Reverse transcriptase domain-containing protein n=1 Tax=Mugilogobius chulae TaxID=88201 RepID=A0AAW0P4S4_9GOBI